MGNNQLKYGWIAGGKTAVPIPIGLSEVIRARSGRFVEKDASGRAEIADQTTDNLIGHLECEEIEAADNDAEGKYTRNLCIDPSAVYRLPLRYETTTYNVNYSAALLFKSCDIVVTDGDIQWADLKGNVDKNLLIIVGGKAATGVGLDDGYVDVMINPLELGYTAVT